MSLPLIYLNKYMSNPYSKAKIYGPYINYKGREFVIVVEKNGKKKTISYPKYLMEVHLGRKLDPDKETVDHWDSDKYNNDISNLRLMKRDEHSANDTRRVLPAKLQCSWCDKEFERSPRVVRDKHRKGVGGAFCSRSCAGKYARSIQLGVMEKLPPPPKVESKYYKKKYVKASIEDFDVDFSFEDLLIYASNDDY